MATSTILDYRRQDLMRTLWTPYWITSAEIVAIDCDDKFALCFSFPASVYGEHNRILIQQAAFVVTEAFAGGTDTVNVGSATIATDTVTTGGSATDVDQDDYIPTANITNATLGLYWAVTGDWITAALLRTNAGPEVITPADATVPCIGVWVAGDATFTAGKGRVIMQVIEVPVVDY